MWIFDYRCITKVCWKQFTDAREDLKIKEFRMTHFRTSGHDGRTIVFVTFSDFNFILNPIWGAERVFFYQNSIILLLFYNDIVNKLKPSHLVLNPGKHGKIFGKNGWWNFKSTGSTVVFRVENRNLIDKFREKKVKRGVVVWIFSRINNKNNKAIKKLKNSGSMGVWECTMCWFFKFIMVSNVVKSRSGWKFNVESSVSVEVWIIQYVFEKKYSRLWKCS